MPQPPQPSERTPPRRRVVILGAGFAGLAACDELAASAGEAGLEVVIVDRHTYNTFQPLLYQVATAGLNPGDIAYPVRSFLRRHGGVGFRQGVVDDVDFEAREVRFSGGDPPLSYDYLVLATGATTNFFGVKGAKDHALAIYTMEDAIAVRDRAASLLEHAATFGPSDAALTVVIVGGGATGVEMAGTLAELRRAELETTYPEIDRSASRIIVVEQLGRLLASFDTRLARYALQALEERGVEVRLERAVEEVAADHVLLSDGEEIPTSLVVWSAGVRAGDLADRLSATKARGGRVQVGDDLRLAGHRDVFAVGDVAAARDRGHDEPLPQLAQPAMQAGRHAARQIVRLQQGRPTEAFCYVDKGIMATIGRRAAVTELPSGIRLKGTLAWLSWLGLHVVFLLGFRNRVAVLSNWAWRYISWRRGTRVIAGT